MEINKDNIGFYDRADAVEPTYDPPLFVNCPMCGGFISDEIDMRTISLGAYAYGRSYFYRTHKSCHEAASAEDRLVVDKEVLDLMEPVPLRGLN